MYVPPPLFTWTGIYVGGEVGYAWGTDKAAATNAVGTEFPNSTPQGFTGGLHVGYNYQISQFVVGIEGSVDGQDFRNTALGPFSGTTYDTHIPIMGSARARVGYAWDRVLIFATGGAAFANLEHAYYNPAGSASTSTSKTGWTVGGGVEYALSNNWSVRGEYRYSDFGRTTDFFAAGTAVHHTVENQVLLGVSYKFDMWAPPAPVVAKY